MNEKEKKFLKIFWIFIIVVILFRIWWMWGPAIQHEIENFHSDEYYFEQGYEVRKHIFPSRDLSHNVAYYYNYKNVNNPSSSELYSFLINDTTDKILYDKNNFTCINYAIAVHDNAGKRGIKSEFIVFNNKPFKSLFDKSIFSHAINAFNTTDKGLIYIDSTQHYQDRKNNDYVGKIINGYYCISPINSDIEFNITNSNCTGIIEKIEIVS